MIILKMSWRRKGRCKCLMRKWIVWRWSQCKNNKNLRKKRRRKRRRRMKQRWQTMRAWKSFQKNLLNKLSPLLQVAKFNNANQSLSAVVVRSSYLSRMVAVILLSLRHLVQSETLVYKVILNHKETPPPSLIVLKRLSWSFKRRILMIVMTNQIVLQRGRRWLKLGLQECNQCKIWGLQLMCIIKHMQH